MSRISPQAKDAAGSVSGAEFQQPDAELSGFAHHEHPHRPVQRPRQQEFQAQFFSGNFGARDTRGDGTNVFNFLDLNRSLGTQATASYRRSYTPRFYGTFTYQFSRQANRTNPFFANVANISGAAGITGNNQEPLNWGTAPARIHPKRHRRTERCERFGNKEPEQRLQLSRYLESRTPQHSVRR